MVSWIKIEHTTPDKPEIIRMGQIMRLNQDAVFGKMVRFWIYCDQHSLTSESIPVTEDFIDKLVNKKGFAKAMRAVGWLQGEDCSLSATNFDRHNGQTAKDRSESARRMSKLRLKKKRNSYGDVTEKTSRTPSPEEEEEEEYNMPATKGRRGRSPLPESLNTPKFAAIWGDWLQHWSETYRQGKPIPEQTAHAHLVALTKLGPDRASIAIQNAITRGLREPAEPLQGLSTSSAKPDKKYTMV